MENKFAKFIENEYGIETFLEWSSRWLELENEEWSFPSFILSLPSKLLNPFVEEGKYYRGMVVGEKIHRPVDSDACSWTSKITSAEYFTERENYIDIIENDGEVAYGIIYEFEGPAISLNKVINSIIEYAETNNMKSAELEYAHYTKNAYFDEEEFIAKFGVNEVTEISVYEYD